MRGLLLLGLVVCAGCGDNAPVCGHVRVLAANRNIWSGQIAADAERVYFSDYDNGVGTHLLFRVPRDGGQALVIAGRGESQRFGYGMTTDDRFVYWTGEDELTGYTLFATPLLGGRSLALTAVTPCTANGVAVDELAAYAGSVRCGDVPARVVAAPFDGSPSRELWSSPDADVAGIAALGGGTVVIATSAGLYRVTPTTAETTTETTIELLDGHPTYHVVVAGDELVYSTEEKILALPVAGGAPRTLYTFHTPITELRAFGLADGDLYISEPPEMVFVASGGAPLPLVRDIGAAVTHIVARDGAAYWSTLALPGSLGVIGTFSGGVLRVDRPCL